MGLENKTALVTGSTSGIGRAIAIELARDGAAVIVSGRDERRGAETVTAIEAEGGSARFAHADMSDLRSVAALAGEAADVDVLINNAGTWTFRPTPEQDVASYDVMFDTNVRGPFFLTSAIAPNMVGRGAGSIVNITTMAAHFGLAGGAVYGASKAAVVSLTQAWAAEFSGSGVRVNAVSPGPVISEGTLADAGPEAMAEMGAAVPLLRPASVDEIARVVAFVASPRASYMTGAVIAADGGRTAV
jgi:NAD(P)-dependent dehydrogenase (short-subunit alcohol dehydrogenase family)